MKPIVTAALVGSLFAATGLITFFWSELVELVPWAGSHNQRALIDEARAAVQSSLRDPSSAQFFDEEIYGTRTAIRTVCGNVNARNGFGGDTGKSIFIYEQRTKLAKIASNLDEATSITQSCRLAKMNELKTELARMCKQVPDNPACKEYR